MTDLTDRARVPVENLRWRMDPKTLPFDTTQELEPLQEIIGQNRGVEAFRFGVQMKKSGYNIFVTGRPGSGRRATVKQLLKEITDKDVRPPDLCYVNNFRNPETPILLRLKAGEGAALKQDIKDLMHTLKREIPNLFSSEEYTNAKKEIIETSEKKAKSFFKNLDQKVKEEGFALVDIQVGQVKRPELMPVVDGQPTPIDQLEEMAEKGRFPREEYREKREKYERLKEQIDHIFKELRDLQKEIHANVEKMDRAAFMNAAAELMEPVYKKYDDPKVQTYLDAMREDMADNLNLFQEQPQPQFAGILPVASEADRFAPYAVNLLVDNGAREGPSIIIEEYPTYKNIFGSIERIVDRSGIWRTDFSKIKAGSLVKANGGFLVLYLNDAIVEPGVWQELKRALKSRKFEFHAFDPFYFFAASGLKPEPIELDLKVVLISDAYLYQLLRHYDEDVGKIFEVRADFDTSMDKSDENIAHLTEFIRTITEEENLRAFDRSAASALVEETVRMTGRQEKISTAFPRIKNLIMEAEYWAGQDGSERVRATHIDKAVAAKIYRSNLIEEKIQEMITRGTLMIDVDGEVTGQVNGLAVYTLGDFSFGKPSRITAAVAMGRAGVINIEREADLSGNTHNKGVLILSGYLRAKYAQDKPLTISASIAFEQSYSGVDGDSASSTEIYALLSSLSGVPLRQDIAVTGSVNQKGEIQAIGGVNQKIEGFFDCCTQLGFTGKQGVLIPYANVKDLMLRKDVVNTVESGRFHIYAVKTIDEGMEILTGRPAGEKSKDGAFPEGSVNDRVNQRLKALAEGLKAFGALDEKNGRKEEKRSPSG